MHLQSQKKYDRLFDILRNIDIRKIAMKDMIYELCPHCNTEVSVLWDAALKGYLTKCPSCGKHLLLCSECISHGCCDYDQESDLCKRVVETMWRELADIPLEIPSSGNEFFEEPFTLQRITFPAGITRTELWHWFDDHHPKGVAYLLYELHKE